jgi:hypothetical protein
LHAGIVSVRRVKSGFGTVKYLVFIDIYRFRGRAVPQIKLFVPQGVPAATAARAEEQPGKTVSRKMLPPALI